MKKTTTVKIPEAYWETPEGGKLYEVMHHDGWEGLDCLNSVIDALGQAIEVTADANIKAELEKIQGTDTPKQKLLPQGRRPASQHILKTTEGRPERRPITQRSLIWQTDFLRKRRATAASDRWTADESCPCFQPSASA